MTVTALTLAPGPAADPGARRALAAANRDLRRQAAALQEAALRGESPRKLRRRAGAFRDTALRHLERENRVLPEPDAARMMRRHARTRTILRELADAATEPPDGGRIRVLVDAWLEEHFFNAPDTQPV